MTSTFAAPKTRYLDVPGGRIAFDDTEGTGTAVLLLPGMLESRTTYRHLRPLLTAAGHRVLTMDLRGFGESSVTWDDYSPAAMADDVLALLAHLGLDRVVLLGHSYTGVTVLKAAGAAPGQVAGLVLLNSFSDQPKPNVLVRWLVRGVGELIPFLPALWPWYLKKVAYRLDGPADRDAYIAGQLDQLRTPGRKRAIRGYVRGDSTEAGWTAGVRCPALVLMGAADPDFPSPQELAERQAALLSARKVMIDGAGHYPMQECPRATADALLPFLAEVA
jgi:pimeloyl-ACP methyl ester carboxylesterase